MVRMHLYQTTTKKGERWTASRAYIDPVRSRPNLHVMTDCLTEKLIVQDGRVTGVQIVRGGRTETLHARSSVVLSAGAFGTPQILMLSGIGPADPATSACSGARSSRNAPPRRSCRRR